MENKFDIYIVNITHEQCIALFDVVVRHTSVHGGRISEFHLILPDDERESHLTFRAENLKRDKHIDVFNTLNAAVRGHGGRITFWTISGCEEAEKDKTI